jgi:hypothetical protein
LADTSRKVINANKQETSKNIGQQVQVNRKRNRTNGSARVRKNKIARQGRWKK